MRKKSIKLKVSIIINILLILILSLTFFKTNMFSSIVSHVLPVAPVYNEDSYYIERTTLFNEIEIPKHSIIFIGDSLTFRNEWQEFFRDKIIVNSGIGSDTIEGVYNRLDPIIESSPKKIFLMIGINDLILNKDMDKIAEEYSNLLNKIKVELPETEVFVESILPVNNEKNGNIVDNKKIKKLNLIISSLATTYEYKFLNIYSVLSNNNQLISEFTEDGIHLKGEGYKIWVDFIQNKVRY